MKKLITLICLGLAAVTVQAQFTNGIQLHAIPSASIPLTGNEIMPLSQITSGTNATRSATVAQVIAAATAQDTSTSNYLAKAASTNAANLTVVSNALTVAQTTSLSTSNAMIGTSNLVVTVSAQLTAANTALGTVSNTVNTANANITANGAAITTLQVVTNSLQTQINTINTAIGNTPTNNTAAVFSRVTTPAYTWPLSISVPSSTAISNNVDFSNGSFQRAFVGFSGFTAPCLFRPINFKDGDNVYLYVVCTNGASGYVGSFDTVTNGVIDYWTTSMSAASGGHSLQMTSATKTALLNWQCFSNNLIFTEAIHP